MTVTGSPRDEAVGSSGEPEDGRRGDDSRLVVTIDGPAGTGKSTVARRVAARLGLLVLDTGAMYRAVSWLVLREGIDPRREEAVVSAIATRPVRAVPADGRSIVLVGDEDPGEDLRSADVESIVSIVAALPRVRSLLVEVQREFADTHPRLVTEGRDQGSVVFPDATVRFFLTASASVRAERRASQLEREGRSVDTGSIRAAIESRDHLDATRTDAPLVRPDGAVEIDTDRLDLDEVVERVVAEVETRIAQAPPGEERC